LTNLNEQLAVTTETDSELPHEKAGWFHLIFLNISTSKTI